METVRLGVGAVAAGVIGFGIGRWLWPDANQSLVRDLPVLQNFDLYYQADDIDFLRLLDREGLLAEGENDHAG